MLGVVPVSFILESLNKEEISMPFHGIGVKGATALAKVLSTNATIVRLVLNNNMIASAGGAIGLSLKTNRTITHLDLSNNQLASQSGPAIAEMIADNEVLKTVLLNFKF